MKLYARSVADDAAGAVSQSAAKASPPTVEEARRFVEDAEKRLLDLSVKCSVTSWVYQTFITNDTLIISAQGDQALKDATAELAAQARRFDGLQLPPDGERKFYLLKHSADIPAPRDAAKSAELPKIVASLQGDYGKGKWCPEGAQGKCLSLNDMENILAKSRDPEGLKRVWIGWHAIAPLMRERYTRMLVLSNEGAKEVGFADVGAMWRSGYDITRWVLFPVLLLASPFCFFSAVADIFADFSSNSAEVKQAYVHWANIYSVLFLITLLAAIILLVVNIRSYRKAGAARNHARIAILLAMVGLSTICAAAQKQTGPESDDWPFYGHDEGGMRYSPLAEINRENVSKLKVAWTFHTGDISNGSGGRPRSGFETTPILVDGTLYITTGFNRVIALDPETGKQRWAFDPKIDQTWDFGDGLINRGASTWLDSDSKSKVCRRRIYEATLDARLISLDASTGLPCADFGKNGQVDLRDVTDYWQGVYHVTSPPAIVDGVIVVGSAINDNTRAVMPSGVVRAFNARTGVLLWKWDPIPPNTEAAAGKSDSSAQAWRSGAANAWSVIVADPERQLFFVPTGSASPDMFGGLRPGDDKWADSVVALRAKTGEVAWGFQLVHHNLWDYDTAAASLLATITRDNEKIPVVIQGNKSGFLYVLNRDTGVPVFPVEERPVPKSDVPGESAAPAQPIPTAPPALVPQHLSSDEIWGITPADRDACRAVIKDMRNEGIFTPPSVQGTLTIPGHVGGMNWSGSAFDPQRGLLVVNTNNLPYLVRLIPRAEFENPANRNLPGEYGRQTGTPYAMYRIPFLAPGSHLPCSAPPWGTLAAVDIAAGKIRWQVPLGSMEHFAGDHPGAAAGSLSLGGPIVTAGGLVFVAGTIDPYLRAFDVETGKELWKAQLPASGHATPMTYRLPNGKQFVVIAAGGHAKISEEPQSDALVAFALP